MRKISLSTITMVIGMIVTVTIISASTQPQGIEEIPRYHMNSGEDGVIIFYDAVTGEYKIEKKENLYKSGNIKRLLYN